MSALMLMVLCRPKNKFQYRVTCNRVQNKHNKFTWLVALPSPKSSFIFHPKGQYKPNKNKYVRENERKESSIVVNSRDISICAVAHGSNGNEDT